MVLGESSYWKKKTKKSISSAVWTWKCITLSLWPLLFFHIFCNLCDPSASGLSFSNPLSLAPKKPWREAGNFWSCQESFRPDMTFKLSTFVLVKLGLPLVSTAIWENVGLRYSEFTLKHHLKHIQCILCNNVDSLNWSWFSQIETMFKNNYMYIYLAWFFCAQQTFQTLIIVLIHCLLPVFSSSQLERPAWVV